MSEPRQQWWQVEVRNEGELVTDLAEARRILSVLDVVPSSGTVEAEDPENGVYLAEIGPAHDEALSNVEHWGNVEPLEAADGYEVWVPQP